MESRNHTDVAALRATPILFATNFALPTKTYDSWALAGGDPSDYECLIDYETTPEGAKTIGLLQSVVPEPTSFGTLFQTIRANPYRGQRLCLSSYIKSESVEGWAGLWMRVDGSRGEPLAFDNMQNRPIQGTLYWTKHDVVLDVPASAKRILFGVLLFGAGQVCLEDLKIKTVEKRIPTTGSTRGVPRCIRPRKKLPIASFANNWPVAIRKYSSRG